MLGQTAELYICQQKVKEQEKAINHLKQTIERKDATIKKLKGELADRGRFGVKSIQSRYNLKDLFQYYTGITYVRFIALFTFLFPHGTDIKYENCRKDINTLSPEDCLFLTLCRLRHNFGLKDLAVRFGLAVQSSSTIFNTWVSHLYLKFGQLCIWPHRDIIIKNMPSEFRKEFPTSLIIIDGTEIKTQVPSTLTLQSQLYSDYKSSTTLKCLIGCDPRGSVMFVSELFTGSISDKSICEQSGFIQTLKDLLSNGYIQVGDAVMADKGFNIEKDLEKIGIKLNIPPFASGGCQMSVEDVKFTQKIARHRIHIERLIGKIKKFKMVSCKIPTNLFQKINQIWTVCCYLTLFQDVVVADTAT